MLSIECQCVIQIRNEQKKEICKLKKLPRARYFHRTTINYKLRYNLNEFVTHLVSAKRNELITLLRFFFLFVPSFLCSNDTQRERVTSIESSTRLFVIHWYAYENFSNASSCHTHTIRTICTSEIQSIERKRAKLKEHVYSILIAPSNCIKRKDESHVYEWIYIFISFTLHRILSEENTTYKILDKYTDTLSSKISIWCACRRLDGATHTSHVCVQTKNQMILFLSLSLLLQIQYITSRSVV